MPLLLVLAMLQAPAVSDAYADARTRELVALARTRRETIDRSIRTYRVTVKERIGAGIRALRRDRMLFRREMVARITWQRDAVALIELLGLRQTIPAAQPAPEVPLDDLDDAARLAFNPGGGDFVIGIGESTFVRHPLAPGSEADYRFASGDTTTIRFGDGRTLRLYELRVIPRRQDFDLMSGSLWIEEQEHAVVRALFKPARPFDLARDADDDDDVPRFLPPVRAEMRYVTIEYGLWEQRWWMPRLVAMDGTVTIGSMVAMPGRYERVYADYEIVGDSMPHHERRVPIESDSAARAEARAACEALGEDVECHCRRGRCLAFRLEVPADTAQLLVSTDLPPAFAGLGDSIMTESEFRDLGSALRDLPAAPWQARFEPPRWGLVRFNRVEALSLGAQQALDLGRLRVTGLARLAVADWHPEAQLTIERSAAWAIFRLSGYHRLAEMDPVTNGLGFGNSLNALLLGRDDGEYFRASGVELRLVPPVTHAPTWTVRAYYEAQRAVNKETDFSLPHLFNNDNVFRANLPAEPGNQLGLVLDLHTSRLVGRAGATVGADLTIHAAQGDFDFGRGALTVRGNAPIGRYAAALEIAAGTSSGTVPLQNHFFLGGPQTLRGYGGAASFGEAFWRARAEVANGLPGARLAFFADAGRAGLRDDFTRQRVLLGLGVGASFLDGLVRIDLARAMVGRRGWRMDFYTDGIL